MWAMSNTGRGLLHPRVSNTGRGLLHPCVSLPRLFPHPQKEPQCACTEGLGTGLFSPPTQRATVHVCYTRTFLSPSTRRGTVCVLSAVHSVQCGLHPCSRA